MDRQEIITQLLDNRRGMQKDMHKYMHGLAKRLPVSRAQLELLFMLKHVQPVHSKELAEQLGSTPGAVSQLLDNLFNQAYVTRTPDPHDRRLQSLQLTRKGDKLVVNLEKQRHEIMERVISELQTEELAVWLRVQQKLLQQFKLEYDKTTKKETK